TQTGFNANTFAVTITYTNLAPLLVIAFSGYQVINVNLLLGTMVAFVGYMDRVYSPLRRLINSSSVLTQSVASIDRVFEFLNEKHDIVDKPNAHQLEQVRGE